jgi:hypothetical protein
MAETEDSREKQRAYQRAWRAANLDALRAKKRAWFAANRDARSAYEREWRAANPERTRELLAKAASKWQAANPILHAYKDHKARAKRRSIAFLLTFEEWKTLWLESGKFDQRGKGQDNYCMARTGDVGPYALGNVRICTRRENNAEQAGIWRGKPRSDETRRKISIGKIAYEARIKAGHVRGT